jgi:hypothetical protein
VSVLRVLILVAAIRVLFEFCAGFLCPFCIFFLGPLLFFWSVSSPDSPSVSAAAAASAAAVALWLWVPLRNVFLVKFLCGIYILDC